MTDRKRKEGQVAVFLVLILAGLVLLFALNVDIFTSSRSKIRLQNSADASALALARWQGATLNMIGDLNIAHLAAICRSNVTAAAGIEQLQRRLAFIGPTIGFKAANELAEKNGVPVSEDMTEITRLVAGFMDDGYRRMLETVTRDGVRAGVDNAAVIRAGYADLRLDPGFYEAIRSKDFRALCRCNGGRHALPDVPSGVPDPAEISLSGENACFGSVGIKMVYGAWYANLAGPLEGIARDLGYGEDVVDGADLERNAHLFALSRWCIYDPEEWRDFPDDFGFSKFPWLTPFREEYAVCGGSATIRVEDRVSLSSIAAQTNFIAAQAAAKILGSVRGAKVTSVTPPLVLPSFSKARLIPFAPGAAGRHGMADIGHVRSMLGILGAPGGEGGYSRLLEIYESEEFRNAAGEWYSRHGHNDADGCCPPGHGTERGGGSAYGI